MCVVSDGGGGRGGRVVCAVMVIPAVVGATVAAVGVFAPPEMIGVFVAVVVVPVTTPSPPLPATTTSGCVSCGSG